MLLYLISRNGKEVGDPMENIYEALRFLKEMKLGKSDEGFVDEIDTDDPEHRVQCYHRIGNETFEED